jgi:two-component system, OmpR family, sensor kinase
VSVAIDGPDDVRVSVAPAAASLVVSNVLDNAVKFSPRGGRVRVGVSIEDGAAVVAVSDNGPGVPEEEAPRLFERFYRGSSARASDTPGVGLGLAICRLVMESQGGSIAVASPPGGGTTIRVRFPLAP